MEKLAVLMVVPKTVKLARTGHRAPKDTSPAPAAQQVDPLVIQMDPPLPTLRVLPEPMPLVLTYHQAATATVQTPQAVFMVRQAQPRKLILVQAVVKLKVVMVMAIHKEEDQTLATILTPIRTLALALATMQTRIGQRAEAARSSRVSKQIHTEKLVLMIPIPQVLVTMQARTRPRVRTEKS